MLITVSSSCFQGKQFSTDWTSAHFPIWSAILGSWRDRSPHVLEIGSWEGRSAIFWLEYLPYSRVVCVDTFDGGVVEPSLSEWRAQLPFIEARFDANLAPYRKRVEKIVGRSVLALERLYAQARTFDIIYVDGGHLRDEVLIDSLLCWPLLKRNGILIWDDYAWGTQRPSAERPQEAIDTFLLLHSGCFTELYRGYQLIIQKIVAPPERTHWAAEAGVQERLEKIDWLKNRVQALRPVTFWLITRPLQTFAQRRTALKAIQRSLSRLSIRRIWRYWLLKIDAGRGKTERS